LSINWTIGRRERDVWWIYGNDNDYLKMTITGGVAGVVGNLGQE
jgi:hypothetical protein